MFRARQRLSLLLFALAFAGCERGCLLRWMSDRQDGVSPTPSVRGKEVDLGGIDCADGLLRCNGGVVETSRIGHLPARCATRAKGEKQAAECTCPWDAIAHCASGCADESAVAIATDLDAGAYQLCKPLTPFARPVLPEDHATVDVCADDGIRCRDGVVSKCDAPASPSQLIAHCIFGCAVGLSLDHEQADGPAMNPDGPVSILCRHSDAEPR